MRIFLIVLIVLVTLAIIFIVFSYVFVTRLINKSFGRLNFEKGKELISYDDIKDKYERTNYSFKSRKNTISAYLYQKGVSDKLVVYVHGMCPGHQGYLSDIISLLDRGYHVFTYDFTATGDSTGNRYIGLNQQYFDLTNALKFLKENNKFGYHHIYAYGHSMGGYGVASLTSDMFSSVVSISGFDSHIRELEYFINKKGKKLFGLLVVTMLKIKYFIDLGFKGDIKCHKVLKKTNTPTLVIHGTNDETVPYKNVSIITKKDLINNPKVEYLEMSDPIHSKHNTVIASTECVKYQEEKMAIYQKVLSETKDPNKAMDEMLKDYDVFKANVANEELMDIICKFYIDNTK